MFFTQVYQMMTQDVDLTMVIRKSTEGLTVSVLPKSNGSLKDDARNHIVPLTVSGTPQELDAGFLGTVARPVQKTCGLISNMQEFEKQADKAAANSKASKEQKNKETKEEKEKREKYEKHMKKAEELIAAKNYKDALTALGGARLYATPQDLKMMDEKTATIKAEMNKGSLFELMEETAQPLQQPGQPVAQQQPMNTAPTMQQPAQQPPQTVMQQPIMQQSGQPMPGQQPVYRQPVQPMAQQYGQYPQGVQQPRQPVQQPMQQSQHAYMQQPGADYGQGSMPYYPEQTVIPAESMGIPDSPPFAEQQPAYRPEEYAEYPDFPQAMLNHNVQPVNPTF